MGYEEKIRDNLTKYYRDELGLKSYERRIKDRIDRLCGKEEAAKLDKLFGLTGKKVLDIGSGWGEIEVEIAKLGGLVAGVEPDKDRVNIALDLATDEGVNIVYYCCPGEKIDLYIESNEYDIVISHSTLEHVNSIPVVIREMVRVTKPGGKIHIVAPNYLRGREGHYKIAYPPMCPKWLARIYLRLRGRKPDFINHINYTTPHGIIRELSKHNVFIEDLGLKNYLNSIKGNGWLRRRVKPLLAKFKLYGSIELVATKLWKSNEKSEETRNAETNL